VSATSYPLGGATVYASTSTQTLVPSPLVTVYDSSFETEKAPKKLEVILYDKGIQTEVLGSPKSKAAGVQWGADQEDKSEEDKEKELERIREELRKEIEEELRLTLEATKLEPTATKVTSERFPLRVLSDEELEAVVDSQEFKEFVDQSSKIIDRALDEQYDLLVDYAHGSGNLDDDDDIYGKGRTRRGRRVKQVSQFWHERWSKKRMISDIAFSPKVCSSTHTIRILIYIVS
jgi:dynein intermediate chain, cytosolic